MKLSQLFTICLLLAPLAEAQQIPDLEEKEKAIEAVKKELGPNSPDDLLIDVKLNDTPALKSWKKDTKEDEENACANHKWGQPPLAPAFGGALVHPNSPPPIPTASVIPFSRNTNR